MKRNIDLNEVSDGRLYTSNDMVRADSRDCSGCSSCCRGMGTSVILDPMDVWRLSTGTGLDFQPLLAEKIELNVVDGMILPNLKMAGEEETCPFLGENGRCTVHPYRPGICRMFPLGRFYTEDGIKYFLQIHECAMKDRGKIKIKKWLGIADIKAYEDYIWKWHGFLNQCSDGLSQLDEQSVRTLTLYVIRTFYQDPYAAGDDGAFYEEVCHRIQKASQLFGFEN